MKSLYKEINNTMQVIEEKWQKKNFSTESFSEIVWNETTNLDLSPLGEVSNQMQLLSLAEVRLQQQRSTFSDLYFQVYHNGRFLIEILNWSGGHVNVHDHDFSAVQFQLKGDSLNAVYDFNSIEEHGALRFGELSLRKAEIWKEGGRSIVRPGREDPHSVLHIGEPTTSLLIRTTPTPRMGAQSNYFPTLAAHYYVSNDIQRKKLTGLSLLAKHTPQQFIKCLTDFLNSQSLSENFFMLVKLGPILFQEKYITVIKEYAARGKFESQLVKSVALNNGIDFFKSKANSTVNITYCEKLAVFSVAATYSSKNFNKLCTDLRDSNFNILSDLHSFIEKLSVSDQKIAKQFLTLFEISEASNETI